MVDLNRIGADLQNVGGIASGASHAFQGAPGGQAAQADQNGFSLDTLGQVLSGIGNILNPQKAQSSPSTGPAATSPKTGLLGLSTTTWIVVGAGAAGLILTVALFSGSKKK